MKNTETETKKISGKSAAYVLGILIIIGAVFISYTHSGAGAGKITGGTAANSASEKVFNLLIYHNAYRPDTFTVNKGDSVTINAITARGTANHVHGVTIDEYNINQKVVTEDPNNPEVIKFVANKVGTFKIWCGTCKDGAFGDEHPDITAWLIVE